MKKLLMMVFLTAVSLFASGSFSMAASFTGSFETSTAVGDDGIPAPTFLYFMGKDAMQVIYWADVSATDREDTSWQLQQQVRRDAPKYTKLLYDNSRFLDVRYVGEIQKDPLGNDAEYGCIRNKWYPLKGLKYELVHPDDVRKGSSYFDEFFCLLLTEDYMKSRCFIPLRNTCPEGETNKPMAGNVVKKLEGRYGLKAKRSELIAKIGDRYTYGIVQFQPQGERALALEVVTDEDEIYVVEEEGRFDPNEPYSVWNVDDEGDYHAGKLFAAFEGPQGLELCFLRLAVESATTGWMFLRDGQLVREEVACYYVYPENPKPEWVKE